MPEEVLKTRITGDASGLDRASKQATQALDKFSKSAAQSSAALNNIPKVSNQVSQAAGKMATSAGKAGGAMAKSGKDFTNFGRVLQDLPYGFTGVQNNLTQLIPAAGAAGLAFTALIAALTFAQVGFGAWTRGMGGSTDALDEQIKKIREAEEALSNYVATRDDVTRAQIKGSQSAQEELVNLRTLYQATQNANIPIAQRKKLVDELQEQYPKYFKNISDEIILAGGATKAYNDLSAAILASARSRAAQDSLVDLQKQLLVIEQQFAAAANETLIAEQRVNAVKAKGMAYETTLLTEKSGQVTKSNDLIRAESTLNDKKQKQIGLQKQINDLQKRAASLTRNITTVIETNPDALLDPAGNVPDIKAAVKIDPVIDLTNVRQKLLEEFSKLKDADILPVDELQTIADQTVDLYVRSMSSAFDRRGRDIPSFTIPLPSVEETLKEAESKLSQIGLALPSMLAATNIFGEPVTLKMEDLLDFTKVSPAEAIEAIQKAVSDVKKGATAAVDGFNQALSSSLQNAMANVAESLGESLVLGDFSGVFQSVAASVGGLMQELGKMLIQTALKVELFKKALYDWAVLNPQLAVAAGVGLIAFGAAIKKMALPEPKKFAKGGIVPGSGSGDTVPAMLTPGEFVVTKDKAPFIAALIKIMGNGMKMPRMVNNRLHFADGGIVPNVRTSPIDRFSITAAPRTVAMPEGDWKIRGKDLVYVMAQTQKSQRRIG